jgi:hypothetical protein
MSRYIDADKIICSRCGGNMHKVWFKEREMKIDIYGRMSETGRVRDAVDYLECDECLLTECVDDSFDGGWHEEVKE